MSSTQSQSSGPTRIGSFVHGSGKSSGLVNGCKTTLSEQAQRLAGKHSSELELLDDVRSYIKAKCTMERDYCAALGKLCNNHLAKKYPQFEGEKDSDTKSIFSVWQSYLAEEEKAAKFRASQYEQISNIYDNMKQIRSHKVHSGKKGLDNYFKKMQEELIASVAEIDKNRKLYFDEEHLAKQARDKEEKIKKRKGGIFSKFTDLQLKKEKSSAHREASDIQSTMARNEYILALAAGNAHFEHFYNIDLPNLMQFIEDDILEKLRGFMANLLESETTSLSNSNETLVKIAQDLQLTSAEITDKLFLAEQSSACLRDMLQLDFEPCDGDTITIISTDHNAELALQHEIAKWMTCFNKECRNLHRLTQQLTRCLNLQASGKKTVEVTGVGVVEVESRIDDIKQQLRKCDISKAKAEARLLAIKQSGMPIEDLVAIENQIANEMRQASLDLDVAQPLSRTPSLRSATISDGRVSSMENKSAYSDDQTESASQEPTPEPKERRSSEADNSESPTEREPTPSYNYDSYDATAAWSDYDPTAAWGESTNQEEAFVEETVKPSETEPSQDYEQSANYEEQSYPAPVDGYQLVGKQVRALYAYQGQGDGELSVDVGQIMTVLSAADQDWVTAQTENRQTGYIPAAFVEIVGDAPVESSFDYSQQSVDYHQHVNGFPEPPPPPAGEEPENKEITSREASIPQTRIEIADQIHYVKALYDYTATSEEEISFKEGDIFKVLERSDDGWWLAEKDGVKGHFPSMLAQLLDEEDEEDHEIEESGEYLSEESIEDVPSPAGPPPPTFAPPKPAYLTPHQVVIIQPTPEIESRGTFGADETIQVPSSNETANEEANEGEDNESTQDKSTKFEVDSSFALDRPAKRTESESYESSEQVASEDGNEKDGVDDTNDEEDRVESSPEEVQIDPEEDDDDVESPETVKNEPARDISEVGKKDSLEDIEPSQLDDNNHFEMSLK